MSLQNTKATPNIFAVARQQWQGQWWLLFAAMALVLVSAVSVIWNSYQSRMAHAQVEALEKQRDELDNEYRALKLANSALSEHSRVEVLAREKLKMERVTAEHEKVVQP